MAILQLPQISRMTGNSAPIDTMETLRAIQKRKCEMSLAYFIRKAWSVIEPGQPYVHGWHIDYLCAHLEAITAGMENDDGTPYNRLLINIPPGTMKSLTVGVFWPAWEWGPMNMPHMRYVCASHSQDLSIRDGLRMRRLISSEWYQSLWGDRVQLTGDQNQKTKFENNATGFRQAAAAGSITGARGDRVIIDDPLSVDGANSDAIRDSTNQWFLEAVPTRLNNPKSSAIVVVMQRLHEEDVSGVILDKELGYDHIMLPMRYDPSRAAPTALGYRDPRREDGELLFPERFPIEVVDRDEKAMGPYATAGQFQQTPEPRGGGIVKREWWQLWDSEAYPMMDYVIASVDTAYTEKSENDMSALTVWGIFSVDTVAQATKVVARNGTLHEYSMSVSREYAEQHPKVIMMHAWAERLPLHELVLKIADSCRKMRVDLLLIEGKASGLSVAQEIRRLYGSEPWGVQIVNPGSQDKMSRLYSIQHLFAEQLIFAPDRSWADMVITQCAQFPRAKHDDLVDTVSMALRHLRSANLLSRPTEHLEEIERNRNMPDRLAPLYGV
jgi:predicted phage terminase large subunit-like protein